jgi:hypothetical protein
MLPELAAQFRAMLTPENLGLLVAVLVGWAVSHAFGPGEVADIIGLITAALGALFFGLNLLRAGEDLFDCLEITVEAKTYSDLDRASDRLAEAITIIGIMAFFALIAKLSSRFKVGEKIKRSITKSDTSKGSPPAQNETPPKLSPKSAEAKPDSKQADNPSSKTGSGKFASQAKLQDHFERHGSDFGAQSPAEYQDQASNFTTGEKPAGVLEKVRPNGDVVRYDPNTDEFGVASRDGIIRTYYKPDPSVHGYPTNMDYYNAQ